MIGTALDMKTTTTQAPTLYLALELSKRLWKLAFTAGGQKVRTATINGGDVAGVLRAVATAKEKLELPANARVLSCYEAGRDGFWIHRRLTKAGIENLVVDPASIEVDRRLRRAKTDRLDAAKLVQQLVRHDERGDRMRAVRVPTAEQEDARRPGRELERLKKEHAAHRARIGDRRQRGDAHCRRVLRLAQLPKRQAGGRLRGADPHAVRERRHLARAGDQQVREQARARHDHRDRLDVASPPAAERARSLVRTTIRCEREQSAAGRDRCARTQATGRALALGGSGHRARRRTDEGVGELQRGGQPGLSNVIGSDELAPTPGQE